MDGGEGGIKKRQEEKEDNKEADTENEKIEAKMVHIPSHIFLHFF